MVKDFIKMLKFKHYIKNLIVFVPLIFSMSIFDVVKVKQSIIMFFSFCLISSVVYILNDIVDIKKDRLHPEKSKRPIASGRISVCCAAFTASVLLCVCILNLCFFNVNPLCIWIVLGYFVLNIFYTLGLKHVSLIDVSCIALGFILRILSGCAAIYVKPSPLVILLTFFFSLFFTFSKRKFEFHMIADKSKLRKSLKDYDLLILNNFILVSAVLTVSFYFTYVLDSDTMLRAGSNYLYVTVIPFSLIIYRLLFLINKAEHGGDPANLLYKDKTVQIFILVYLLSILVLII